MNTTKNNGFELLEFISLKEKDIDDYQPLAGSYAVIKCKEKYLLCYNKYRKQWEVPAGQREENETPKECALRELYEETGQIVTDIEFKGLLKVKNTMNGNIKFNPVYFTTIKELQPFIENEETSDIVLWNLYDEIGNIDSVDIKIFEYV
ncbi:NUDIX hydrolase [Psychrobacillus sp. FSL H8-0483]|uniref:NUDIX hydrolase n=1 Tax=Psychrobacillus sp. FSL H8-0483 TaxID=2921389 RepID=UPI00315ABE1E